jgi:membrane-bound metal-dependent hydrolase YbcI (DUF457 family)
MANFDTHFHGGAVVGIVGVGLGSAFGLFSPLEGGLYLAASIVGGLLPDIDESNSIPSRVVQYLLASFLSLGGILKGLELNVGLVPHWAVAVLIGVISYFAILSLFQFLQQFVRHRGVFHSIPMGILLGIWAVEAGYYLLHLPNFQAYLLGGFLGLGFLTHLVLDEIYSVEWRKRRLKKSFGTALKFWSNSPKATSRLYILLIISLFFLPQFTFKG